MKAGIHKFEIVNSGRDLDGSIWLFVFPLCNCAPSRRSSARTCMIEKPMPASCLFLPFCEASPAGAGRDGEER
jgi:hypothetical protein